MTRPSALTALCLMGAPVIILAPGGGVTGLISSFGLDASALADSSTSTPAPQPSSTKPATHRLASRPSSAPATQFAGLVPNDTLYRVMKGTITKIDRGNRKLSFTWRNPDAIQDMPLSMIIKEGALIQVDYEDVPLTKILPGRETILMVKIEPGPDGSGRKLIATTIRQNKTTDLTR